MSMNMNQSKGESKMSKSSTGLEENLASALCYVLGLITGIIFLVVDGQNPRIKFHAMQSILWHLAFIVVYVILTITIIGWVLLPIVGLLGLISWLYLMWQAYSGNKFKLPVVGDMAENMAK